MVKSKLRKKVRKSRSVSDKKGYNQQRNQCGNLLKECSDQYLVLIQIPIVTGNEKLCKIHLKCFSFY